MRPGKIRQMLLVVWLLLVCSLLVPRTLADADRSGQGNGILPTPANLSLTVTSDGSRFLDTGAWASYDAGSQGLGQDLDGYYANIFDGRFVYFVPYYNDAYHGEVLRYDTALNFTDISAWQAFDPGANGVGADPDGYTGALFDGRYIYFTPLYNGSEYFGEVLRYDTQGEFTRAAAWSTYDPGANGVGSDADGFMGGVFDGRYLYFAPYHNGSNFHGEVLRFDTTAQFADSAAWTTFDANGQGLGAEPAGFYGASFDGRYVYFTPYENSGGRHGEVLRLDTLGPFAELTSWSTFDPAGSGVGTNPRGYTGQVIAAGFLYLSPSHNGADFHGEILRYDLSAPFTAASAWSSFDPGANGVGHDPDGYYDATFDGQFIYFTPFHNGSAYHGEFLRYDTRAAFTDEESYTTFVPSSHGVGTAPQGYLGAIQAGDAIYFTPYYDGSNYHGEVLRLQVSRDANLQWNQVSSQGTSFNVFKNGNLLTTVGATTYQDAAPGQGDIFGVQAVDASGATSPFALIHSPLTGVAVQIDDRTAPLIYLLNDEEIMSGLVTLEIIASDGFDAPEQLDVIFQSEGNAWRSANWDAQSGTFLAYWDTTTEVEGAATLTIRASDQAGNTTDLEQGFTIVALTPTAINLNSARQLPADGVWLWALGGLLILALATCGVALNLSEGLPESR